MASVPAIFFVIAISVWARPVVSLAGYKGEAVSFDLNVELPPDVAKPSRTKGFDEPEMPEVLKADLTMERFGRKSLNLVRSRYMGMPSRTMTSPDGTILETTSFENKNVHIYTDTNMKASVACDLRRDKESGTRRCQTSVLISIDDFSCYIGSGAEMADCTPKVPGRRAIEEKRLDEPRNTRSLSGKTEWTLPVPGFHVVEIIAAVDATLMATFYARHGEDSTAAQAEMTIYMSLYTNELNVILDSLSLFSRKFAVYAYLTTILIPEPETDFDWAANFREGGFFRESVQQNEEMKDFTTKVLQQNKADHVIAMTGLNMVSWNGDTNSQGYAWLNAVCSGNDAYKFQIMEFLNVDGANTGAHMLGTALGAAHDEHYGCPGQFVMTEDHYFVPRSLSEVESFNKFSNCSFKAIRKHLKSCNATLVNGFTDEQFKEFYCSGFIGNQNFSSLDRQCQIRTGLADSEACGLAIDKACYEFGEIRCLTEKGCDEESLGIVWNGTPCGTDKMCFAGRCVESYDICPAPPVAPCTCCGYSSYQRRNQCCKSGRKNHDRAHCYCCGHDLKRTEAPEGFDGPTY